MWGITFRSSRHAARRSPHSRVAPSPFQPSLPAALVGDPPPTNTTTRATRSTQCGCCRLALRDKSRGFQPPTGKPYKIRSGFALRSHLFPSVRVEVVEGSVSLRTSGAAERPSSRRLLDYCRRVWRIRDPSSSQLPPYLQQKCDASGAHFFSLFLLPTLSAAGGRTQVARHLTQLNHCG